MNLPKHFILQTAFIAALALPASAVVNIDYVNVGNAGNAADPATGSLYGAVAYDYGIAKNETTITQYAEFLNAVAKTDSYNLYNTDMASYTPTASIQRIGTSGSYSYTVIGSGNRPITYVSWFDAARFANWLHNGQQTGVGAAITAETGAYTLNGATSGMGFTKNVEATVWIPSENEWYKAAYYDPNKGGVGIGGYWARATQSDTLAGNTIGVADSANYFDGNTAYDQNGLTSYITDGGAFGSNSESYYGTNDQAGNVIEWTDGVRHGDRVFRGGAWTGDEFQASAVWSGFNVPHLESYSYGFRLASVIPEPTTGLLAVLGLFPLLSRRRNS